jgi:CDP-glycerol glycerophosphotransferase (TagB/SpsB family)
MSPATLRVVEELAQRWDHVLLKFKNEHPDGLADLQVADVLITNMSSIANLFYATGRPTIHVFPVRDEHESFAWRRLWLGKIRESSVTSVRDIWKLRPEINGGWMAHSHDELLAQVDQALADPSCCSARASWFVDTYMLGADGKACERVRGSLLELAQHA